MVHHNGVEWWKCQLRQITNPSERCAQKVMKVTDESPIRASISFPPDLYRTLEELARRKKVSVAWVVRDAAEQYLANQSQVHKQK